MTDTEVTVPGKQTLVFVLKVEGAGNGTEIAPTFEFKLTGNDDNDKVTLTDEKITVSANAKYNVRLARNTSLTKRVLGLDYEGQGIDGRVYGYAFILQLYNDNPSKGLKGIEYPQGEITFDINLTMQRTEFESTELEDITDEATPILWNYKVNYGSPIISNRTMSFANNGSNSRRAAPSGVRGDRNCSVYNSGNILMEQNGSTISVTVNNYDFDGRFPQFNYEYKSDSPIDYSDNIGCFSVGYFQLIVPDNDATTIGERNYYLRVSDSNFNATSITGINTKNQMVTTDDSNSLTHVRYNPGSYNHHIYLWENGKMLQSIFTMGDTVRARG